MFRIRIQVVAEFESDPGPDLGFYDLKRLQKTFRRRRSLQSNREVFKHEIYSFFPFFEGSSASQDPDPDLLTPLKPDPTGPGSETLSESTRFLGPLP